jgi:hypothetical protein
MQAERDYLKQIVFPMVEEELEKRRIKLEIVDLRWGVDITSIEQENGREATNVWQKESRHVQLFSDEYNTELSDI